MRLEGWYQLPGRAAREAAQLTLSPSSLTLTTASQQQPFQLSDVSVSPALGSIPLTLTFRDGGRFVPARDDVFRHWWHQQHKPGLVYRLERYRRGVLLALMATVLLVVLYVTVLLPAASRLLAQHMPISLVKQAGEQTLSLLQHVGFTASELPPEQQQRVARIFQASMPPEMMQGGLPLTLRVMKASLGANAFMLPDGTLIVTDELVTLAKNDDGLAAVMLHEAGHHFYHHPMQGVVRSGLISLTLLWLTGDVSGTADTLLQSAVLLHQLQFSRDMERQADQFALVQMKAEGRPVAAMAEIFRQLQQTEQSRASLGLPAWLQTHPGMEERIREIESR